jgi:hypothetical protein
MSQQRRRQRQQQEQHGRTFAARSGGGCDTTNEVGAGEPGGAVKRAGSANCRRRAAQQLRAQLAPIAPRRRM